MRGVVQSAQERAGAALSLLASGAKTMRPSRLRPPMVARFRASSVVAAISREWFGGPFVA